MWAIANLTGNNRVSRALMVRYSALSLDSTESTSVLAKSLFYRHAPNVAAAPSTSASNPPSTTTQLILPVDGEDTITCFCR